MGTAMSAAGRHAVSLRTEASLSAAVSDELQAYVGRHYQALVLRPALTDPELHRAFVAALREAHAGYSRALAELDDAVVAFVAAEGRPHGAPKSSDVVVTLDWAAQLQKVEHVPLAYEKSPELSVALVGMGGAAGKIAGGAAMGGAAKALGAKLAAPFATKAASATLGGGAAAGAAGGVLAGPAGAALGAAAGAALGLGVDVAVNAGVALMQRPVFVADVQAVLEATALEWEERLLPELERVEGVWFGSAERLLRAPRD